MKNPAIKFCAMAMAVCTFSIACNKDDINSTFDPEPEGDPVVSFPCEHGNLEFVAAVERTDTTPGNIAHYHCLECNRRFLDEAATNEISHVWLPAKNRAIDSTILNRIKDIYPFVSSSEQTKGLIPEPVSTLYGKVKDFKDQKVNTLTAARALSDLNEIKTTVDQIDSKVTVIQDQVQTILKLVTNNQTIQKLEKLQDQADFIWNTCKQYLEWYQLDYQAFVNGQIGEQDFLTDIYDLATAWGKTEDVNGGNIYTITRTLIQQFSGVRVSQETLTYPQLFKKYIACYRIWDNEGYTDRKQLDLAMQSTLSLGYLMVCLYRENTKVIPTSLARRQDSSALATSFGKIDSLVNDDLNKMKKAYDNYRHFNDGKHEYYIYPSRWSPNPDCISDNNRLTDYGIAFKYNDEDNCIKAFDNMVKCWDDVYGIDIRSGNCLTPDDYSNILSAYPGGNIYTILADNAKVGSMSHQYADGWFLVYPNKREFKGDSENYRGNFYEAEIRYNEFYVSINSGIKKPSNGCWVYMYPMGNTCQRVDNMSRIMGAYRIASRSKSDTFKILGKYDSGGKNGYWSNGNRPMYIRKYTGTKYD